MAIFYFVQFTIKIIQIQEKIYVKRLESSLYFKFTPTTPPIIPEAIAAIIIIIEYIFISNPLTVIPDKIYINNIYTNPIIPPFKIPFFLIEPAPIELPN